MNLPRVLDRSTRDVEVGEVEDTAFVDDDLDAPAYVPRALDDLCVLGFNRLGFVVPARRCLRLLAGQLRPRLEISFSA